MAVKSEPKNNDAITLYADSRAGQLYLKIISGIANEARVLIKNLKGMTMLERNIPTNQLTFVPLSEIAEGLYIAQVEFENKIVSQEFKF